MIPLVDTKMFLPNGLLVDFKYLKQEGNTYCFGIVNPNIFTQIAAFLKQNSIYTFITVFNGKIYKWQSTLFNINADEQFCSFIYPSIIEITDDRRKERLIIKDKVFIQSIYFNGNFIDLKGKLIPTITKDISESGILFYTNLDLTELERYPDNEISLSFDGDVLNGLGSKNVTVKRNFRNGNTYFYGCQFKIKDFEDFKQINKIVQILKRQ